MSQQSTSESSDCLSNFIKTVVRDVLDGVIPILNEFKDSIEQLTTRVNSLEERVAVEHNEVGSVKSSLEKLRSRSGVMHLELQRIEHLGHVRDCKSSAASVCAFPVKRPPSSAGDPADTRKS
jgi:archaellum component FlaC